MQSAMFSIGFVISTIHDVVDRPEVNKLGDVPTVDG